MTGKVQRQMRGSLRCGGDAPPPVEMTCLGGGVEENGQRQVQKQIPYGDDNQNGKMQRQMRMRMQTAGVNARAGATANARADAGPFQRWL
jgi:hypothetical protein